MAGYIGTKAVALSTTTGNILGDMTVGVLQMQLHWNLTVCQAQAL